ncbi:C1 family peptidase [Enterococcus sp. LJL99]
MEQITKETVDSMLNECLKTKKDVVAKNAVTTNGIFKAAENGASIGSNNFIFSIDVDCEKVANQNQSGRCWMFACLNILRFHIEKQYNMKTVELSQNYMYFWDKLEKANYFYENILETATDSLGDPVVRYLLKTPQQDGGDWNLIVSLIEKYGVVPKEAMPESSCSINSAELDTMLNKKLRKDAVKLRQMKKEQATESEINQAKDELVREVFRMLVISLGMPPKKIDFSFYTKDKTYQSFKQLTPLEFYKDYIDLDLSEYVGIINVPTEDMPRNTLYEVAYSGNMVDGIPNQYLNVEMNELKKMTIEQLKANEPVWFGCDVLQSSDRNKGVMAHDLYDFATLFDVDFEMTKGERFNYQESLPTHAMVISGVDLDDNLPTKWKVENSWGDKVGDNGFFVMDDAWMDDYVFEVVVKKSLLSKEQQAILISKPVVLPFWNPMNPIA